MPATTFRQGAPDQLELHAGGGCLALLGVPFLASGIFLILLALQVLPLSNAEEVPLYAWPVMLLTGLIFVAFSSGLVFGRTRVLIDAGAGRVTRQWRVLVPLRHEEHSLLDYQAVTLRFTQDSESADTYDVALQGLDGRGDLALVSLTQYGPALAQAESLAGFLRLPLVDASTDHAAVVAWDRTGQTWLERLAAGDEPPLVEVDPPPALRSEVRAAGQTILIRIPRPAVSAVGLLGYAIPLAILIFVGPQVLRFFNATETPVPIQVCFSGFFLLVFVALPLLGLVNATLAARRGGTFVTASSGGLVLEQRGAWRSQTTSIPAWDILGLDYSTPESGLRAAEAAAAHHGARTWPTAGPDSPEADRADLAPAWVGRLARVVRPGGVAVKSRQGLFTFGAGLPGPEVRYLWALVRPGGRGRPPAGSSNP